MMDWTDIRIMVCLVGFIGSIGFIVHYTKKNWPWIEIDNLAKSYLAAFIFAVGTLCR